MSTSTGGSTSENTSTTSHPPTLTLTVTQFEQYTASAIQDALSTFEVLFCTEDHSHYPASKEWEFLKVHGDHQFVRFFANEPVENGPRGRVASLNIEFPIVQGEYMLLLAVDGDKVSQDEARPINESVQLRMIPTSSLREAD